MLTDKLSGLGSTLHHSFIGALTGSGRVYVGKQLPSPALRIYALADIVIYDRQFLDEDGVVIPVNRNRTASNAIYDHGYGRRARRRSTASTGDACF